MKWIFQCQYFFLFTSGNIDLDWPDLGFDVSKNIQLKYQPFLIKLMMKSTWLTLSEFGAVGRVLLSMDLWLVLPFCNLYLNWCSKIWFIDLSAFSLDWVNSAVYKTWFRESDIFHLRSNLKIRCLTLSYEVQSRDRMSHYILWDPIQRSDVSLHLVRSNLKITYPTIISWDPIWRSDISPSSHEIQSRGWISHVIS